MMTRYRFVLAPEPMCRAAESLQLRFGISFSTLTHFTPDALHRLHTRGADEAALMADALVASEHDTGVLSRTALLTRVANLADPSPSDRAEYFAALQDVYRRFDALVPANRRRLVLAPEREGRILAEALGWLRPGRDLAPHAKRIPYDHGLLIGLSDCALVQRPDVLVCIDGAIASGATMLALLDLLAEPGVPVEIYSVHAAREGVRAILRFARARGLDVHVRTGHITDGLSSKFYAIDPGGRLVVGDLGDMIHSVTAGVAP